MTSNLCASSSKIWMSISKTSSIPALKFREVLTQFGVAGQGGSG
jgi:N-glycosylase/DNA lyase